MACIRLYCPPPLVLPALLAHVRATFKGRADGVLYRSNLSISVPLSPFTAVVVGAGRRCLLHFVRQAEAHFFKERNRLPLFALGWSMMAFMRAAMVRREALPHTSAWQQAVGVCSC